MDRHVNYVYELFHINNIPVLHFPCILHMLVNDKLRKTLEVCSVSVMVCLIIRISFDCSMFS
jgi:hypothetical protein